MNIDLRIGGSWRIAMRRHADDAAIAVAGRFLEVRPAERLVYTWVWEGTLDHMPPSRVTVEFRNLRGGTELRLEQVAFPDIATWHQHRRGWIDACDRMEHVL